MQHGKLRTDRCSWFIDRFFQLIFTHTSPASFSAALCCLYIPATTRSESTSRSARKDLEPTEIEDTDKNEDAESARGDLLRDMSEWLEEFTENRVDEGVAEHRDELFSRVSFRAAEKSGMGQKHSIKTQFPKDRNCYICMKTKMTMAPCRKRAGTAVPRAENFGDLITADHKVLSEKM